MICEQIEAYQNYHTVYPILYVFVLQDQGVVYHT